MTSDNTLTMPRSYHVENVGFRSYKNSTHNGTKNNVVDAVGYKKKKMTIQNKNGKALK